MRRDMSHSRGTVLAFNREIPMNDIKNLLQAVRIGAPQQARNLTMFPLLAEADLRRTT